MAGRLDRVGHGTAIRPLLASCLHDSIWNGGGGMLVQECVHLQVAELQGALLLRNLEGTPQPLSRPILFSSGAFMESILSYLQTFDYSGEALILFTQSPHYSF